MLSTTSVIHRLEYLNDEADGSIMKSRFVRLLAKSQAERCQSVRFAPEGAKVVEAKSINDNERCPLEIEGLRKDRERRKKVLVPCI